jgi:predicted 2-oxoglutarate/Fe(II)-dependent dioxygenase YbiX
MNEFVEKKGGRPKGSPNKKNYKWKVTIFDNDTKSFKHGKFTSVNHINQEFNLNLNSESQTKIHWFNYLTRKLSDLIINYERDVLKGVSLNISKFNEINILRYENQGHYKPHVDDCINHHRTLSIILLLNDDYEGGELIFKSVDLQKDLHIIDVKKNRAVLFPSNFMYPHTVKPVTKGTRYSIVSWAL